MELTKENKRWIYIIVAVILILFVVSLMLKFWHYTLLAIACFGAGFYYGRRSKRDKETKKKGTGLFDL